MSHTSRGAGTIEQGVDIIKSLGFVLPDFSAEKENRENIKAFAERLKADTGEKKPSVSDKSCTIYETTGKQVQAVAKELRENDVPCVVLKNKKTESTVIVVPKSLEAKADIIIGEHNRAQTNRQDFFKENAGNDVKAVEVTKEQELLASLALKDQGVAVGFKTETTLNGNKYTDKHMIYFKKEDARSVEAAIFMAKALTTGANAERAQKVVNHIRDSRDTVGEAIRDPKKMIAFSDVDKGDKAPVYVVNDIGLFKIENDKRELMASRSLDEKKFETTTAKLITNCKKPVVNSIKDRDQMGDFFSRESIRLAKEHMAMMDANSGKVEQAEVLASQIATLKISSGGLDNKALVSTLNEKVTFSAVIANERSDDKANKAMTELADRYTRLGLSPEEDKAVAQFIRNTFNETVRSENEKTIVANDLSIREISDVIEREQDGQERVPNDIDRDGIPDDVNKNNPDDHEDHAD